MRTLAATPLTIAARELETPAWNQHSKPPISLYQALSSWFVYHGQAYNVQSAPPALFNAWLVSVTPARWTAADKALNLAIEPDNGDADERELCRWCSLCGVLRGKKPLARVYASQEEAQRSMQALK